jgi:hypothetical protein
MNTRQQRVAAIIAVSAVVLVLISPFVTAAPHNISKGLHLPVQVPVALLSAGSLLVRPTDVVFAAHAALVPASRAERVLALTCTWLC